MKSIKDVSVEVESIVDGLGMPIDVGIKKGVIALRMAGISTAGSCEGHIDRGLPYPWILIQSPVSPNEDEDYQKQLNGKERDKVKALLEQFYTDRISDQPLIIQNQGAYGAFRLQSVPWGKEATTDISTYRNEMDAFADFVIERLHKYS